MGTAIAIVSHSAFFASRSLRAETIRCTTVWSVQ